MHSGKLKIAGWKTDPDWMIEDVFPIEDGDTSAIAMLVYQKVIGPGYGNI